MLDEADRRILENVNEHGWHVALVLEQGTTPGWGYSIGFYHTFRHPEVVVFGLPKDLAHSVINFVGDDIKAGKRFESGKQYAELLDGVLCTLQRVEKVWYRPFLGRAIAFYNGEAFPVLQCVWPDKDQNYPWDPKYRSDWLWAQPLLFHSDPTKANAKGLLRSTGMSLDQTRIS